MNGGASGASMLEVLVAGALLATTLIAVMGALAQGAREVDVAADLTASLLLINKVVEETSYGLEVDPDIERALVVGQLGAERHALDEPGCPFFEAIEDTREPWGRLLDGVDSRIGPEEPLLLRHYGTFGLSVHVEGYPGSPGRVLEMWVGLDRRVDATRSRTYGVTTLLAAPPAPSAGSALPADARRARVAADSALVQMAPLDREIAAATRAADAEVDVEHFVRLGRLYERKGALALGALLCQRQPVLERASLLWPVFRVSAAQALASFHRAASRGRELDVRPHRRFVLERKVLELAELCASMPGVDDRGFAKLWARAMRERYRGRNRWIEHYLDSEPDRLVLAERLRQVSDAGSETGASLPPVGPR